MTPAHFPKLDPALVARMDVPGPRYTSYPTAPEWSTDFGAADHARAVWQAATEAQGAPLSLYVHLPFCHSLCTFCGCNVIVSHDQNRADTYLDGLERELDLYASLLGSRRTLSQLHWGGGTPTFLTVAQLERLWNMVRARFEPRDGAEIAVEVHPARTSFEQLELLRGLGFNRLSMGVQDFDQRVQTLIGRHQSVEATTDLVAHARRLGFEGVNFDLIYGLPGQTLETWTETLQRVVELRPDRLAIYGFAYLPSLRAQQRKIDPDLLPFGAEKLALLGRATDVLVGAGWETIGFDHFALPTDGLVRARRRRTLGRNFQGFTVCAAPDTIACGVTGISDIGGAYAQNHKKPSAYFDSVRQGRLPTERGLWLTPEDRRRRQWITQLMCNDGLVLDRGAVRTLDYELEALQGLAADGLVLLTDTTDGGLDLELTPVGRIFARQVAKVFDARLRAHAVSERPTYSRAV